MTTTKITLPGQARSGWRFDPRAVREAVAFFDIAEPVIVKSTAGERRIGAHRWRPGVGHVITVSGLLSDWRASQTLWHELTHAAQIERAESPEAFHTQYRSSNRRVGYDANPYERQAREHEMLHETLPLVKDCGPVDGLLFVPRGPLPHTSREAVAARRAAYLARRQRA